MTERPQHAEFFSVGTRSVSDFRGEELFPAMQTGVLVTSRLPSGDRANPWLPN